MASTAAFAETAALVGDPARASMLAALMDGRALTAAELAGVAGVTPQTASGHLGRLTEAGLLAVAAQGRHRYHRLASPAVARMLESIMAVAGINRPAPLRTGPADRALRHARTCYDHLAGEVAVRLFDTLVSRQWLTPDGETLTPLGLEKLAQMGIVLAAGSSRRKLTCGCLDWSERRYHPGGVLGATLLRWFTEQRWIKTEQGSRHVIFTPLGIRKLETEFGVKTTR